jgi:CheY-like chemotaxis protein
MTYTGTDAAAVQSDGETVTVPPCVLVVDDDPSIRDLYATMFHGEGYRVEMAVDGQDGLDRLSCHPDLIMLDLMMPVMNGQEFLRRLRTLANHATTPVVVVSAANAGATLKGAQGVVQKPFDVEALLGRVSGLLALAI